MVHDFIKGLYENLTETERANLIKSATAAFFDGEKITEKVLFCFDDNPCREIQMRHHDLVQIMRILGVPEDELFTYANARVQEIASRAKELGFSTNVFADYGFGDMDMSRPEIAGLIINRIKQNELPFGSQEFKLVSEGSLLYSFYISREVNDIGSLIELANLFLSTGNYQRAGWCAQAAGNEDMLFAAAKLARYAGLLHDSAEILSRVTGKRNKAIAEIISLANEAEYISAAMSILEYAGENEKFRSFGMGGSYNRELRSGKAYKLMRKLALKSLEEGVHFSAVEALMAIDDKKLLAQVGDRAFQEAVDLYTENYEKVQAEIGPNMKTIGCGGMMAMVSVRKEVTDGIGILLKAAATCYAYIGDTEKWKETCNAYFELHRENPHSDSEMGTVGEQYAMMGDIEGLKKVMDHMELMIRQHPKSYWETRLRGNSYTTGLQTYMDNLNAGLPYRGIYERPEVFFPLLVTGQTERMLEVLSEEPAETEINMEITGHEYRDRQDSAYELYLSTLATHDPERLDALGTFLMEEHPLISFFAYHAACVIRHAS